MSNSAGRAASQIYRWPRGQPNLIFCQIALAGQQKTLAGHMAKVDWYVQVYIYTCTSIIEHIVEETQISLKVLIITDVVKVFPDKITAILHVILWHNTGNNICFLPIEMGEKPKIGWCPFSGTLWTHESTQVLWCFWVLGQGSTEGTISVK